MRVVAIQERDGARVRFGNTGGARVWLRFKVESQPGDQSNPSRDREGAGSVDARPPTTAHNLLTPFNRRQVGLRY
jgi:hypothetical protein